MIIVTASGQEKRDFIRLKVRQAHEDSDLACSVIFRKKDNSLRTLVFEPRKANEYVRKGSEATTPAHELRVVDMDVFNNLKGLPLQQALTIAFRKINLDQVRELRIPKRGDDGYDTFFFGEDDEATG